MCSFLYWSVIEPCFNEKRKCFYVIEYEFLSYLLQKTKKKNEDYALASFQFSWV